MVDNSRPAAIRCPRCGSEDIHDNREFSDYECETCGVWFDLREPDREKPKAP